MLVPKIEPPPLLVVDPNNGVLVELALVAATVPNKGAVVVLTLVVATDDPNNSDGFDVSIAAEPNVGVAPVAPPNMELVSLLGVENEDVPNTFVGAVVELVAVDGEQIVKEPNRFVVLSAVDEDAAVTTVSLAVDGSVASFVLGTDREPKEKLEVVEVAGEGAITATLEVVVIVGAATVDTVSVEPPNAVAAAPKLNLISILGISVFVDKSVGLAVLANPPKENPELAVVAGGGFTEPNMVVELVGSAVVDDAAGAIDVVDETGATGVIVVLPKDNADGGTVCTEVVTVVSGGVALVVVAAGILTLPNSPVFGVVCASDEPKTSVVADVGVAALFGSTLLASTFCNKFVSVGKDAFAAPSASFPEGGTISAFLFTSSFIVSDVIRSWCLSLESSNPVAEG